jgi:hypothetical protein
MQYTWPVPRDGGGRNGGGSDQDSDSCIRNGQMQEAKAYHRLGLAGLFSRAEHLSE